MWKHFGVHELQCDCNICSSASSSIATTFGEAMDHMSYYKSECSDAKRGVQRVSKCIKAKNFFQPEYSDSLFALQ